VIGACGAKTRRGTLCTLKGNGKGGRCRFHGGKSTGPRTVAGRIAIAAAARRRWERWREENGRLLPDLSAQYERTVRKAFAEATGVEFHLQQAEEVDRWRIDQSNTAWRNRALRDDAEINESLAGMRAAALKSQLARRAVDHHERLLR
jgi:hypothetical protein